MLFQDHKFDVSQVLTYFRRKEDGDLALLYEMEAEEVTSSRGIVEMDVSSNRCLKLAFRFVKGTNPSQDKEIRTYFLQTGRYLVEIRYKA